MPGWVAPGSGSTPSRYSEEEMLRMFQRMAAKERRDDFERDSGARPKRDSADPRRPPQRRGRGKPGYPYIGDPMPGGDLNEEDDRGKFTIWW
jgi:hypothetical protein